MMKISIPEHIEMAEYYLYLLQENYIETLDDRLSKAMEFLSTFDGSKEEKIKLRTRYDYLHQRWAMFTNIHKTLTTLTDDYKRLYGFVFADDSERAKKILAQAGSVPEPVFDGTKFTKEKAQSTERHHREVDTGDSGDVE